MKSTRVCRKCRKPQLIENLEAFLEGSVKRFKCADGCKASNSQEIENEPAEAQINVAQEEIVDTEELEIELNYLGNEKLISDERQQILTTFIIGEAINYDFCKTLALYSKVNNAPIHIFFKKRYAKDDEGLDYVISIIYDLFNEVEFYCHFSDDLVFNNQLEVRASANVHHTAIRPLSGVKALAKTDYLVIPHARQEIEVTVGQTYAEKSLLMSTGCVNELSKGHTQALAKVKFHSVAGAVIYDPLKAEGYGLFAINYSNKHSNFSSFDKTYHANGEVTTAEVDTVYLDDWHSSLVDMDYQAKVRTILGVLKPLQVVSGDVFDGRSVCYHEQNNLAYASSRMSLMEEVDITKEVIRDLMANVPTADFVFLGSNHHNFFTKFFSNPSNFKVLDKRDAAESYRALAYLIENTNSTYRGIEYADPMKYFFNDLYQEGWFKFTPEERVGIKFSYHGCEYKIGVGLGNTSNVKGVYGHTHSPQQIKGNIWVGHAMVEFPTYQSGMNNAAHGFCTIYSSGKRQLLVDL